MSKPENFILSTDYPTLKNDGNSSISITIPASITITAAEGYWQSTESITVGSIGSFIRPTIKSSRNNKEYVVRNLYELGTASSPVGANYYIIIDVYRKNSTTMEVSVFIPNNLYPATTLVTENITETITVKLATFLSPFN